MNAAAPLASAPADSLPLIAPRVPQVPHIAASGPLEARKRVISKPLRRLLENYERQVGDALVLLWYFWCFPRALLVSVFSLFWCSAARNWSP